MNHQFPSFHSPTYIQKGNKKALELEQYGPSSGALPLSLSQTRKVGRAALGGPPDGRWTPPASRALQLPREPGISLRVAHVRRAQRLALVFSLVSSRGLRLPEAVLRSMKAGRPQGGSCTCAAWFGGLYLSRGQKGATC